MKMLSWIKKNLRKEKDIRNGTDVDQVLEQDTMSESIISYEEQNDNDSAEENSLKQQPSAVENEINGLMNHAVTTAGNALVYQNKRPLLKEGTEKLFMEADLTGSASSPMDMIEDSTS
ncbi:unnamed protein product [Dovyalis caffra]|uniref:Uncharacterized protein n=1 Tax=Dovyalis caffra TaxID=77055 RepID=A0AAV1RK48_9ROSI|nr:unnamed protein product [Dovyalis caffra]